MRGALKELGYVDTYHMDSCMENPPDCDLWAEALDAKFNGKGRTFGKEDWDQLLGHCQVSESMLMRVPCTRYVEATDVSRWAL